MKQLIETIEKLRVQGIGFRSLTEAIDTTTAQGVLVFHMGTSKNIRSRRDDRRLRAARCVPGTSIAPMTTLKQKLIKIGAKVVSHGRYVAFQMAEVAIPRILFADILRMIAELRPPPAVAST
jgi:hypothetical protein